MYSLNKGEYMQLSGISGYQNRTTFMFFRLLTSEMAIVRLAEKMAMFGHLGFV